VSEVGCCRFLYSGGSFTVINAPGAEYSITYALGINDSSQIVGTTNNDVFSFLYSGGIFTTISDQGNGTGANGINDAGQIVGCYYDAIGGHGFLYSGGVFTILDDPLADKPFAGYTNGTCATGINNSGQIVGYYQTYGAINHGFLATPVQFPKPVSHVSSLPATETSPNFLVQWSATDVVGPGIATYTIYISDNGGAFTPWQTATAATQAWYPGFLGHKYGFFSQATDNAGNIEDLKSAPEAITQTPAQSAEDVNGDGQINCADVDLVKASFGKKTGQPEFNPAADVNRDGVVNVIDLALITQKLIPGTVCQ
jgi:probable HAF family extracellular repeat protein